MSLTPREAEAQYLQNRVPLFTRRFLHIDAGPGLLCHIVNQRCGAETHALYLGNDPAELATARTHAQRVLTTLDELAESPTQFDCIAITPSTPEIEAEVNSLLPLLTPFLTPDAYVVIARSQPVHLENPVQFLAYATWPYDCPLSEQEIPFSPAPGEPYVEILVHPNYDPIAHAQRLAAARSFDRAYEVLCAIPPQRREDITFDCRAQLLKMICVLGLHKLGGYPPLTALAAGIFLFSRLQRSKPNQPDALRVLSRFWDAVGDTPSGDRYRTLADEFENKPAPRTPLPEFRHCEESPTKQSPQRPPASFSSSPNPPPRVLYIPGEPRMNYGHDILYHGLKQILGEANVTEFPFKPTLHGAPDAKFGHYPCLFNHPGTPLAPDDLLAALRAGNFDLIFWGDTEMFLPPELARAILAAAPRAKLALLDMQDDCADHWQELKDYLALDALPACFKREKIRAANYSAPTHALPFAYPDELVATDISTPRKTPLFWAGQRGWALRDAFLPLLEARGLDTRKAYTQAEYRAALRDATACINLAGAGFDTVRYWEAPAQGCLLLSEALPIEIPHDFQDMRDALIFNTQQDLHDRLDYLAAHPTEAEALRHAGWQRLQEHHTATARARQLLSTLGSLTQSRFA